MSEPTRCDSCSREFAKKERIFYKDNQRLCRGCGTAPIGYKVFQDSIPGGLVLENYGPTPVTVYSHTERKALAASQGKEEFVRHVGVPGTDKSPHTQSWATMDPYTMEAARILVSRAGAKITHDEEAEGDEFAARTIRHFETSGDAADLRRVVEAVNAK